MSRAFIREDVDPPERSGRVRSASGLPPGAMNYITAHGARRLGAELNELRRANSDPARIAELGDKVKLEDGHTVTIVKIEHRGD